MVTSTTQAAEAAAAASCQHLAFQLVLHMRRASCLQRCSHLCAAHVNMLDAPQSLPTASPYAVTYSCHTNEPHSALCHRHACTVTAQALLDHLYKDKNSKLYHVYQYEDGHILDLAAGKGDAKMVQLLLDFNMTVGPSAMAHAAHRNHTAVMEVSKASTPMALRATNCTCTWG